MKKKKIENWYEDAINAFRKANREIELERNGGRWIAVNRLHKNKKKYDRKRDRKISSDGLFNFGLFYRFQTKYAFLFCKDATCLMFVK